MMAFLCASESGVLFWQEVDALKREPWCARRICGAARPARRVSGHAMPMALLCLSIGAIWLFAVWSLYRHAHPLVAFFLLFVALLQLGVCLVGVRRKSTVRPSAPTFPRKKGGAMPWHGVGMVLTDNEFNERVSVPVVPSVHAERHAERMERRTGGRRNRCG